MASNKGMGTPLPGANVAMGAFDAGCSAVFSLRSQICGCHKIRPFAAVTEIRNNYRDIAVRIGDVEQAAKPMLTLLGCRMAAVSSTMS